jgi:hypothetical protein
MVSRGSRTAFFLVMFCLGCGGVTRLEAGGVGLGVGSLEGETLEVYLICFLNQSKRKNFSLWRLTGGCLLRAA